MTDNDIIKALERCNDNYSCPTDCPLYEDNRDCLLALNKPTLNLIHRQKTEIERLNGDRHKISRLVLTLIKVAETEAVKKFAKRLKEEAICSKTPFFGYRYYQIYDKTIDGLIEEMVGEN